MDLISKTLEFIGNSKAATSVLQIGAMNGIDFDDTRGYLDRYSSWECLLVEPIPYLFAELKENFKDRLNYTFEQCAITDSIGTARMLFIPPEAIEQEELHPGYKGMSALYPLKNGFGSDSERDAEVRLKFGEDTSVPTLTLDGLMQKHGKKSFDIFLCDAEGFDWVIFKQLDFSKFRPKFIRLEYINLTETEKQLTQDKLKAAGYVVEIRQDIDATRRDIYEELDYNISGVAFNFQSGNLEMVEDPIQEQLRLLTKRLEVLENSKQNTGEKDLCISHPVMDDSFEIIDFSISAAAGVIPFKPLPTTSESAKDLTVVSGLWDIGRPGRNWQDYLHNFNQLLKIPNNLFLYIPASLEDYVWERRSKENTRVKIMELEDLKAHYGTHWDATQEIRNDERWYKQQSWLEYSPQSVCEWYNPIVQSKMSLLHDVKIWNPFDTDYLIWLDAGITNTVSSTHFIEHSILDKIIPYLKSFLFLSYPYEANTEIHGFEYGAMNRYANAKVEYVCRGGLFGGHKDFISDTNATYWHILNNSLSEGLMGTEESIFTIMSYLYPEVYRRYALDGNGLITKFTEDLINNDGKVDLVEVQQKTPSIAKDVYNKSVDKTSLYILTFNFPRQLLTLLESLVVHEDFLTATTKVIVDNSTDGAAIQLNADICETYGFEHIITGKNGGICGGRQFVAEHFQKSGNDYYFFFEDDMCLHPPDESSTCRNGFRNYIPHLYKKVHQIMAKEGFDFLKLSFTEVFMDNNLQVAWYNVPQNVRTAVWPDYDRLPVSGLDPHCPRTEFDRIDRYQDLSYITGQIYYANWPMIVSREGNRKMFLDTTWSFPYEQTWMSHMFQETRAGRLNPAVLLASPINHNRIEHYKPEERREN